MPKIVDHDQRRAELGAHVIRVIAREGLARTTVRGVAREAGFTSGILSHYFTGKEDMINFAFNAISNDIYERIDRRFERVSTPEERLRVVIEELLPIGQGDDGSIVSIVFWASAIHEPALRAQFERLYDKWRGYVARILDEAAAAGDIPPLSDPKLSTEMVVAATDGLVISWTLQPERMKMKERRKAVDFILQAAGFDIVAARKPVALVAG